MEKGKVKWYDSTKGFGFIVSDDGSDVFMHRTGLLMHPDEVQDNMQVIFELKQSERGPVAINVQQES